MNNLPIPSMSSCVDEKVYCKDCVHNGESFHNPGWEWCESPHLDKTTVRGSAYTGKQTVTEKRAIRKVTLNYRGGCKHFRGHGDLDRDIREIKERIKKVKKCERGVKKKKFIDKITKKLKVRKLKW